MSLYKYILKVIVFSLVILTAQRILFYFFNLNYFHQIPTSEILWSCILGIRFDLSVLLLFQVLVIGTTLVIFPKKIPYYSTTIKRIAFLPGIPLFLLNYIDLSYFPFSKRRSGIELLHLNKDIIDQSTQLLINFWYIPLLYIITIYLFYKICFQSLQIQQLPFKKKQIIIAILIIPIWIIGWRGGLQYKAIKPDHAFVQTDQRLGQLVLNTPHQLVTSIAFQGQENIIFFPNQEIHLNIPLNNKSHHYPTNAKTNVVIIILESFRSEYSILFDSTNTYMPFLDSLGTTNTYLRRHLSNGHKSIEVLPSLFASIPGITDEPLITGPYQTNKINSLPQILRDNGYNTSFFHGGRNGTMGFDQFCKRTGIQQYFGMNEYPDQNDFDGNWGIYDEPYLKYFCNQLDQFKAPFFTSIFTLSSHQPYTIPKKHEGKFPKGNLDIHETIGYTDYSLKEFFRLAKTKPWYSNTVFIITADHVQQSAYPAYYNIWNDHWVPLVIFHPTIKFNIDENLVSQHNDIPHTIIDLLRIDKKANSSNYILPLGNSLLDTTIKREALLAMNQSYYLVNKSHAIEYHRGNKTFNYIKTSNYLKSNQCLADSIHKELENNFKQKIQYFTVGLNENNWYK